MLDQTAQAGQAAAPAAPVGRRRTERLTVAQALIRFLAAQRVTRDGAEPHPFFGGATGIFGHGNLAGVGQALLQYRHDFRYYQARNEQGMAHMATGYARMHNRLATLACTSSVGPGATNMVTGAAVATVNRLPILLLPSDVFADRLVAPVLQQIEQPWSQDVTANDSFRAVSRYWDRIYRPEQLITALFEAMRTLVSPADTGAVTLCLPQDVQAEAADWPIELFQERVWDVPRARADERSLERAAAAIVGARRPVIIAGGGVIYSEATDALRAFVEATGISVGETQAGKGSLPWDHPLCLGALGASGSAYANGLANEADVVIGVGTRYTDFTTASKTLFRHDGVQFVNLNVGELDSFKHAGIPVTGDARESLRMLAQQIGGHRVDAGYRAAAERAAADWRADVDAQIRPEGEGLPAQAEVIGRVNAAAAPEDVVVNAAGSLPGDLHRLWRAGEPGTYHMEYGFSCMGYEIAGALGAKIAAPEREVFAFIGDGTWLMMSQEILTSVQEHRKLIVVLVDNQGYGSIEALSKVSGSQGFGTRFQFRDDDGQLAGEQLPIDLSANARSLGAETIDVDSGEDLEAALTQARANDRTTVIHVRVNPQGRFGGSGAWWDVPVAEISELESTNDARTAYEQSARHQRYYLGAPRS
jgi:3D-(3,5/4)-trihydroxycyclohexane-1,2-dione acylhydrolase (decyclizing)